jgi:hypothetical protein
MRRRYNRVVLALLCGAAALFMAGCPKIPKISVPKPPVVKPTPKPAPTCKDHEILVNETCATPTPLCDANLSRSCWHLEGPDEPWLWRGRDGVTDYADPAAEPAEVVEPPVTPPVVPHVASGCNLDDVIDPDTLTGIEPKPTAPAGLGNDVNGAQAALTGCQPQSGDCVVGAYDPWVAKVAEVLRVKGWCVGTRIHPDALAVSDPSNLSINYAVHVHNAGGDKARWWPSAYVDAWRSPAAPPTTATACSAPVPTHVKKLKLDVYVKPNRIIVDATINTGDLAYCTSIGMGEMGGLPRATCPVRNECPGFKCEERQACEALFPLTWSGIGWTVPDNPAQREVPRGVGGTVTACAGGTCQSVEVQP